MQRRVAVTGLGFVTPLGTDVPTTWHALVAGTSGAGPITRFDPARLPVRFACEVKGFDPARYMDKKEIRRFDLFAQFAMAAATEALTDAGIPDLNGVDATSHWLMLDFLGSLGAKPTPERVVFAGDRIVTAAGVSAGIDMALALVERIEGRERAEIVQLAIEYDPQPPFDAGSPAKARPEIVTGAQQMFAAVLAGSR